MVHDDERIKIYPEWNVNAEDVNWSLIAAGLKSIQSGM